MMRLGVVALDSDKVEKLSDSYARILGRTKSTQILDGGEWITVVKGDCNEMLSLSQENSECKRPKWPSEKEEQQQTIHLDLYASMDEYESKAEHAVQCGTIVVESRFSDRWAIMANILGRPSCIIPLPDDIYKQRYGK